MKYIVLFAAFDDNHSFSRKEIDDGEGCWGVSSNGKKPTEYEFFPCDSRDDAIFVKTLFKNYNESFWKLLRTIQCIDSRNDALETISKMTNFPD